MSAPVDADTGRDDLADDPAGVDLTCEQCGSSFEHTGRGRRPKRCPACRTSSPRATREQAEEEPKRPGRPRAIDQLQGQIHAQLGLLGMGLMFFDQFDAEVVLKKSEKGAKALANLAQTNPAIRKTLEKGVELAGWGPVAMWGAEMMLPIMAHHGLIRGVPDPARVHVPPQNPGPPGG